MPAAPRLSRGAGHSLTHSLTHSPNQHTPLAGHMYAVDSLVLDCVFTGKCPPECPANRPNTPNHPLGPAGNTHKSSQALTGLIQASHLDIARNTRKSPSPSSTAPLEPCCWRCLSATHTLCKCSAGWLAWHCIGAACRLPAPARKILFGPTHSSRWLPVSRTGVRNTEAVAICGVQQ